MQISVYLDDKSRILGLNQDNLSGCTDWVSVDAARLGLSIDSNLTNENGEAMYRLVDGAAVRCDTSED